MNPELDMESIIIENLTETMNDIFDDRNDDCIEEGIQFIQTISSIKNTISSTLKGVFENMLGQCMESLKILDENDVSINQFVNMKDNMGDEKSPIGNQPLSNVEVFTTLYDKGYIKEPYMQKHIASQTHSLKSTVSDLMGRDWMSGILDSKATQTSLNDWIDGNYILEWNKELATTNMLDLNALNKKDLMEAIMFQTTKLHESIADGTYEDMCVNAIMCYEFAALVALIAKLGHTLENDSKIKNIVKRLVSFGESFGKNDFFACCCMVINLLYAESAFHRESNQDRISILYHSASNADLFNSWIGNRLRLPNKDIFPCKLSSLLESLELEFDFRVTRDDAKSLGLPTPILMPERICGEDNDTRPNGMILEESVKFGQSFSDIEH